MNGTLSPELLAERMAELDRSARTYRRVATHRSTPLRTRLGHAFIVLGTRLEGQDPDSSVGLG